MASADGTVIINTAIDAAPYSKGLHDMESAAKTTFQSISREGENAFNKLRNLAATIGISLGVKQVATLAEEMTNLEARAKIASKGMMDVSTIMERLRTIADRAYSPLQATAESFMNNSFALNDLGISMERQLDLADAMTNALVVSGAKGETFELVMNAVNRSLAMGKMRGEELEMVLKYGGAAAEGMAKHLGTTLNGLKDMARQGKLTSDVIADSLIANMDDWRAQADAWDATIGDAIVRLRNQLLVSVNEINKSTGFEQSIVKGIDYIKESLDAAMPQILSGFQTLKGALETVGPAIPSLVTGFVGLKLAKTNLFKSISDGLPTLGKLADGFKTTVKGMKEGETALKSFANAFTGLDAEITKGKSPWEVLQFKFSGSNDGIMNSLKERSDSLFEEFIVAADKAAALKIKMEELQASKANLAAGSKEEIELQEQLTAATDNYAEEAQHAAKVRQQSAAAYAQYRAAVENDTVTQARQRVEGVRMAQAEVQANILRANSERALATTEVERQAIETRLVTLRGQLNALEIEGAAAATALATAQSGVAITSRIAAAAITGVKTAAKGLYALAGGGIGLAMIGVGTALGYIMSRESEAEKMARLYGDAVEDLAKKHNILAESVEGAGDAIEGIETTTLTQLRIKVEEAAKGAEDAHKKLLAVRSMFQDKDWIATGETGYDTSNMADLFLHDAGLSEKMLLERVEMLKGLTPEFRIALKELYDAIETGEGDIIGMIQALDRNFNPELLKFFGTDEWKKILTALLNPDKGNMGAAMVYQAAADGLKELSEAAAELEERNKQPGANLLKSLTEADLAPLEKSLRMIEEAGIDISRMNFSDVLKQLGSMESAEKKLREEADKSIKAIREQRKKIQAELEKLEKSDEGDPAEIAAAKRRLEDANALEMFLESKKKEGIVAIKAQMFAELAVMEQESLRGIKVTSEEAIEIKRREAEAYIRMQYDQEIATKKSHAEMLKSIIDMAEKGVKAYATLGVAGRFLGGIVGSLADGLKLGVDKAKTKYDEMMAELKTMTDERDNAINHILAGMPKPGESKTGGGGKSQTEDDADKATKALRQVEMQLAQIEGRKLDVIDREALEELEEFEKLLAEANVDGEQAAESLERFKKAQAAQTRTAGLEEQLSFYEEMSGVLPGAAEKASIMKKELNGIQAELLVASGISREFADAWLDIANTEADVTFWGGIRRGVNEYSKAMTDADFANSMVTNSLDALSDGLTGLISGSMSAKEAFSNMANAIVQGLMKMAIQMMVVQPLFNAISSMFGGFGGGGAAAAGGAKNIGNVSVGKSHFGGIVGYDSSGTATVPEWLFRAAPRYHSGGIAGLSASEIPIIAQKGEMVLTMADQRSLMESLRNRPSGEGMQVNVQIVNQTSVPVNADTRASQGRGGQMNLEVFLKEIDSGLAKRHAKGTSSFGTSIESANQLNPATSLYRRG
jgi:tape measure domain-containing protein